METLNKFLNLTALFVLSAAVGLAFGEQSVEFLSYLKDHPTVAVVIFILVIMFAFVWVDVQKTFSIR